MSDRGRSLRITSPQFHLELSSCFLPIVRFLSENPSVGQDSKLKTLNEKAISYVRENFSSKTNKRKQN